MSGERESALAFGITLALIVGIRLTLAGLVLLGLALIVGLLVVGWPHAREWLTAHALPEVRIERPVIDGRARPASRPPRDRIRRIAATARGTRRGGWPHLEGRRPRVVVD